MKKNTDPELVIEDGNLRYFKIRFDEPRMDFISKSVIEGKLSSIKGNPLHPECISFIKKYYHPKENLHKLYYRKLKNYLCTYHYEYTCRKETPAEIFAGDVVYTINGHDHMLLDGNYPKRFNITGWSIPFLKKAVEDGELKSIYGVPVRNSLKKIILKCTNVPELAFRLKCRFYFPTLRSYLNTEKSNPMSGKPTA